MIDIVRQAEQEQLGAACGYEALRKLNLEFGIPCIVLVLRKKDFYLIAEMYLGTMKGWIRHYFRFYSGSTKVLPGPPKYLLHQCPS